jgi:DNA-binding transcriptional LysR family regulator
MDLRKLHYALAVADEGSFTAAARACFVAQPSLSQAVRSLESELGVALFDRLGRTVRLTPAGEAFVGAARQVVRAVDGIQAEVQAVAGLLAGRLDLVALPTLAVDPVTPLVGAFRRAHPGVMVRLAHPDSTAELLDRIRDGDSEIGLTERAADTRDLVVHELGHQELVAVFPPGAPRRRRVGMAELSRHPLVVPPRGTSTRATLDAALVVAGVSADVAVETNQREAIVPLVLAGAGAAVLPRPMADDARRQGAVVAPLDPPISREIAFVHRRRPLSPAGRAFVALASAT